MAVDTDYRLADAKAIPIERVAEMLEITGLRRAGVERTGPCPQCGGDDRFSINTRKGLFNCRICGGHGDQIELVAWLRGTDFRGALDWLCGPSQVLTEAERAARARKAAEAEARRARESEKYRRDARTAAWRLWSEGVNANGTPVRAYLARRGIPEDRFPVLPASLRYHPDCPYMVQDGRSWREAWRGPAMLAAVQGKDGRFIGLHRTWIDPDRPNGKAEIVDPATGEALKAKKTLGSVKGGAIRLLTPATAMKLVVGEGIETTLSALIAGNPACAYWAGVSLGNMAGHAQSGPGLRYSGLPDMADAEAFVPPAWVREMILIQDGDSEPRLTRAKLLCGARRAMASRPGLVARIVRAPEGKDLNDVLRGDGRG